MEQLFDLSKTTILSFCLPFGSDFRHHGHDVTDCWLRTAKVKSLSFGALLIEGHPFLSQFRGLNLNDVRYRASTTLSAINRQGLA